MSVMNYLDMPPYSVTPCLHSSLRYKLHYPLLGPLNEKGGEGERKKGRKKMRKNGKRKRERKGGGGGRKKRESDRENQREEREGDREKGKRERLGSTNHRTTVSTIDTLQWYTPTYKDHCPNCPSVHIT